MQRLPHDSHPRTRRNLANDPSSRPADRAHNAVARTRVYAVLGGIASGKSAVARWLAGSGGEVLDADELVAELFARDDFRRRVAQAFGPGVLLADGRIDRPGLARAVFGDGAARSLLESWTHPHVREQIRARLEAARRAGVPRVILDVPLLLENEADHLLPAECDALIFVEAPARERERRAMETRGWESGEVARREALQLPLENKRGRAQHVIVNDGNREQLKSAVETVLRTLEPTAV